MNDEYRVLVCGGRAWVDVDMVVGALSSLPPGTRVIEGGARGGDRCARLAAERLNLPVTTFPADWARDGRVAGFKRNRRMLDEGAPQLVLAFKQNFDRGLRHGGTEHMVQLSLAAGLPVWLYEFSATPDKLMLARGVVVTV